MPTVVLGVALLILFQRGFIPVGLGLIQLALGHVIIALPFAVLILLPRIASIDKRLEEAAYDLGASGWQMFRRVMLLLIFPSILSAYLIAFVFSIDEVVIAAFIAGAGLAIGAAWSGLLSNFAAGAFLVVLRPFKAGDHVTTAGVTGTVTEVGLFTATLLTQDNVRTFIGNSKVLGSILRNYHRSEEHTS